ncbi:hypothetical protein J3R30DRAFT_3426974 [Lentinula aciculospora]|uniref:Uncharacterized protein n=1 Tax=Lentinula aciculospora TaxID=153920 RepID=A0A9W9AWN7_9AGAR|nr:hypothetical protein J3R30DRAFT_3426974 [Lentinula aciculospora]
MLSTRPVSRNAEANTHRHAFKTPSRALAENRVGLGVVKGIGKAAAVQTPSQSKTPFQKPLFSEADIQLKGSFQAPARPFLDKTPFPNRTVQQTPYIHPTSTSDTPDSALRPSSTRRHIRVPRSSQKFETPGNTQNNWDVNDYSVDSIPVALPDLSKLAPPEDDFDEIEYMPPNTLDLPYQPPFDLDLPDYKVLGKAIMEASRNGAFHQPEPPVELEIRQEDIGFCDVNLEFLSIPDEDPFFDLPYEKSVNPLSSKPIPRSIVTCPMPLPARTRTGAGVPNSGSPSTVVNSKMSRPVTSTAIRSTSRPVPQVAAVSTSNSKTTHPRPVVHAPLMSSKSNAFPRVPIRPSSVSMSRSKSTTASSRSATTNARAPAGLKRPASSAAASIKTTSRSIATTTATSTLKRPTPSTSTLTQRTTSSVGPRTTGTVTAAAKKPVRVAGVVAQDVDLGNIVLLDRVEANFMDDFMFDI